MATGRHRNKPCWCGSGIKYKRCHLNRADDAPANPGEALTAEKRARKRTCLCPLEDGCSSVIKAHTVQNKLLKRLAKNGHVLAVGPESLGKALSAGFEPQLVGTEKASTFTGSCGKHDNKIFSPIEDSEPTPCREHAFLLGYRPICMELYKKQSTLEQAEVMFSFDRGLALRGQIEHQEMVQSYLAGSKLGLRDFENQKVAQDEMLRSGNHEKIRACFFTFEERAPLLASTAIQPEHDFEGTELQNLSTDGPLGALDVVSFSLIESHERALAVFSWLDGNHCARMLAESLLRLPKERQGAAILRFAFEYTENLFMSPEWWDSLAGQSRRWIKEKYLSSIETERTAKALVEDHVTLQALTLTDVTSI